MSRTKKQLVCASLIALVALTGAAAAVATSGWHYAGQWTGINVIGSSTRVDAVYGYGFTYSAPGTYTLRLYDTAGKWSWKRTFTQTQYLGGFDSGEVYADSGHNVVGTLGHDFPNGDQFCAKWSGTDAPTGNPCITIIK